MVFQELHHDRMNIATRAAVTVIAGVIGNEQYIKRLLLGGFIGIFRLLLGGFIGISRRLQGGIVGIVRLFECGHVGTVGIVIPPLLHGGIFGSYRLSHNGIFGSFRLWQGGRVGIVRLFLGGGAGIFRLLLGGFVDSIRLRVPRAGFNTRVVVVRLECARGCRSQIDIKKSS